MSDTLSEKFDTSVPYGFSFGDVREAVKKLKEELTGNIEKFANMSMSECDKIIKEIFGEGLIHSPTNARESSQAFDNEISKGVKPLSDNIQNSEDKK